MLAVQAHALLRDAQTRANLGLPPIAEAAAILQADDTPGGRSRQRRAIARLAAYRFDGKGFDGRTVAALKALHVDPAALAAAAMASLPTRGVHATRPGVHRVATLQRVQSSESPAGLTVAELESVIADLPELQARTPKCGWQKLKQWVTPINDVPPQAPSVWTTVEIRVPRPIDDVAAAVDPQNLDECGKFFCPATPAPGHVFRARKTLLGGIAAEPPLPSGEPYPEPQLVFEDFRCPPGSACTTQVQNLLEVYTWRGSSTAPTGIALAPDSKRADRWYRATYALKEPISARLTADGPPVKLEIDGGSLVAQEDQSTPDAWTHLYADKQVRYAEDFAQMAVHVTLLHAELMGELAEVACCAPNMPQSCGNP